MKALEAGQLSRKEVDSPCPIPYLAMCFSSIYLSGCSSKGPGFDSQHQNQVAHRRSDTFFGSL